MKTIYMQAYNDRNDVIQSACPDGLGFSIAGTYLLISNRAMWKYEKSYFEVTIDEYTAVKDIKNIPFYIGVQKEPSRGILNNDGLVCSVFYPLGGNYDIIEYKKFDTPAQTSSSPENITARVPGTKDVIGCGIDTMNNTITVYVNGKVLYSASPKRFTMAGSDGAYYPCIYFPNNNASVKGTVNFGKYRLSYLPDGYMNMNTAASRRDFTTSIRGNVIVLRDGLTCSKSLYSNLRIESIKGDGTTKLEKSSIVDPSVIKEDGVSFSIPEDGDWLAVNLPIPYEQKIYIELMPKNGIVRTDYRGIPISLGISKSKYNLDNSFMFDLYHFHHSDYMYRITDRGVEEQYYIESVDTSIPNVQGKTVGIGIDFRLGVIDVWVNKIKFFRYKISGIDTEHDNYFIIQNTGAYTGYVEGYINLGEKEKDADDNITMNSLFKEFPIDMDMNGRYVSLWYYYNKMYRIPVDGINDIKGLITVIPNHNYFRRILYGSINVIDKYSDDKRFQSGINKLMTTYNTISNNNKNYTDPKFKNVYYLDRLERKYNNGKFKDDMYGPIEEDIKIVKELASKILVLVRYHITDLPSSINVLQFINAYISGDVTIPAKLTESTKNYLENIDISRLTTRELNALITVARMYQSDVLNGNLSIPRIYQSDILNGDLIVGRGSKTFSLSKYSMNAMPDKYDSIRTYPASNLNYIIDVLNTNLYGDIKADYLFAYCGELTTVDTSKFDTTYITTMQYMFQECNSLTSVDVSGFNTSNVTNMSYMFKNCYSIGKIDSSKFNTSKVTTMEGMFEECNSLTSVDVSGFDTSNVTDMSYMFKGCQSIETINSSKFNTSKVTTMKNMFDDCNCLVSLDVSGFDTSNVTDMSYMFRSCCSLESLDVSKFNTSKVTTMAYMFNDCNTLSVIDVSGFDTSNVTDMSYMFNDCRSVKNLDVSRFNVKKVTNMNSMFANCELITSLNLSSFENNCVTNTGSMFMNMGQLTTLDISKINTSKVTNMIKMFSGCSDLQSIIGVINISGILTSAKKQQNMQNMLNDTSITSITLTYDPSITFDKSLITSALLKGDNTLTINWA